MYLSVDSNAVWKTACIGSKEARHLDGSLHIIDMLSIGVVSGKPVARAEEQILLHGHVAVHDVILHVILASGPPRNGV